MQKATTYIGIDISKDSFDVAIPNGEGYDSLQLANDALGFDALLGALPADSCCVMEATGAYYCALAVFLHGHQRQVSVVNPLCVSHFARMLLRRAKTDRADARLLSQFGAQQQPPPWQPLPAHLTALRQELAVLEQLGKQRLALSNQRKSLALVPQHSQRALQAIGAQIESLDRAIGQLEGGMQQSMKDHYPGLFQLLQSIPGIGPKTALVLVAVTQGFTAFGSSRQLVAYVGLAPRHYQSGRSVRGRGAICKMGMRQVRCLLYMCAQTALKSNPACHALFERLRQKGKPFKLAKIAVAAKLLKQAFAIAKSGLAFQPDYNAK